MLDNVHHKDKIDKTGQTGRIDLIDNTTKDSEAQNATTVNNQDIWLRNAQDKQPKNNVMAVKNLDTLPKIAPMVTENLLLNVTSVTKLVISPNNAQVKF